MLTTILSALSENPLSNTEVFKTNDFLKEMS